MGADNFYSTSDPSNFKKLKGYFDLMINTVSIVLDSNKYMKMLALDGDDGIGWTSRERNINWCLLIN